MKESDYKDLVYGLLISMKMGEELFIVQKVKPDNRDKFINIVKEFIDHDNGRHLGFYMEFDNSFTKIRKRTI